MDALPARHQLTRLQSDALLSLSEQLLQLERRFDACGIVIDDSRLQAVEARAAAVEQDVAVLARRIEAMEALLEQHTQHFDDQIKKLKEHTRFPIDWLAVIEARRR